MHTVQQSFGAAVPTRSGTAGINPERLAALRNSVGPILGGSNPSDPHTVADFVVRHLRETPGIEPHLEKVEHFHAHVKALNGSLKAEGLKFKIHALIDSITGGR